MTSFDIIIDHGAIIQRYIGGALLVGEVLVEVTDVDFYVFVVLTRSGHWPLKRLNGKEETYCTEDKLAWD